MYTWLSLHLLCLGIVSPVGTDGMPPTHMDWYRERKRERETERQGERHSLHSSECYICDVHSSSSCCTACHTRTLPPSPSPHSPHACYRGHSDTSPVETSHKQHTDPRDTEQGRNEAQLR